MKTGFYPRLAFDGIRKNARLYIPYLLTCAGMAALYYIIVYLQYNAAVAALPGSNVVLGTVALGEKVIAVFSGIFLFYTNSFLIRRRKKEFGLYNILGMGKGHIGIILFWETLIVALFSLSVGLCAGIAFSKLAELGMVNLLMGTVSYRLSLPPQAVLKTLAVFSVIFGLLLLNALCQIRFLGALSLLHSETVGEKPPRGNLLLGLLGLALLAAAYYTAVTLEDPVAALVYFFGAVILVILGTYLTMISGSVVFCRFLQRRKRFYYQPAHFVPVSSMVYRMKRNGAGLASICILSTMVLVMISSTASLYFGMNDAMKRRYPREMNITCILQDPEDLSDENIRSLQSRISAAAQSCGIEPKEAYAVRSVYFSGHLNRDLVETDISMQSFFANADSQMYQLYFVPLADYNASMGTDHALADNEAYLSLGSSQRFDYPYDTLSIQHGNTFQVRGVLQDFMEDGGASAVILPGLNVIVPNLEQAVSGLEDLAYFGGNRLITPRWICSFDTGADPEIQAALSGRLGELFGDPALREQYGLTSFSCENREANRADFLTMYGGFFYLGIMLSLVFVSAAVLIMYYKQISEGYEDQLRFGIMQKVGMTDREIRRSVNSQILTVFFLPLLFSACHLAFAFPILSRLLLLFNIDNTRLFLAVTAVCFCVFAAFYTFTYRVTSNAYYHIVRGGTN